MAGARTNGTGGRAQMVRGGLGAAGVGGYRGVTDGSRAQMLREGWGFAACLCAGVTIVRAFSSGDGGFRLKRGVFGACILGFAAACWCARDTGSGNSERGTRNFFSMSLAPRSPGPLVPDFFGDADDSLAALACHRACVVGEVSVVDLAAAGFEAGAEGSFGFAFGDDAAGELVGVGLVVFVLGGLEA